MGKVLTRGGGDSVDLSFITAEANRILTGYKGANQNGEEVNGSIPIVSGSTITPGTSQKTAIAAGNYANDAIYVAGDPDLIAANIKKGVSIFGKVGTFEGFVPGTGDVYYNGSWGSGYDSGSLRIASGASIAFNSQSMRLSDSKTSNDQSIVMLNHAFTSGRITLKGSFLPKGVSAVVFLVRALTTNGSSDRFVFSQSTDGSYSINGTTYNVGSSNVVQVYTTYSSSSAIDLTIQVPSTGGPWYFGFHGAGTAGEHFDISRITVS